MLVWSQAINGSALVAGLVGIDFDPFHPAFQLLGPLKFHA
jgi:hypothetical protein